jgi:hypothetical protein
MLNHRTTSTTTIDFQQMATDKNGYKPTLPHPMNSKMTFISKNGEEFTLLVGQVAILVAAATKFKTPGEAIDQILAGLSSNDVSKVCGEF